MKGTLAPVVLPGVALAAETINDNDSYHECVVNAADTSHQLLRIAVSYGVTNFANSVSINKELADGSANSKQQCPGGATLPSVSAGLPSETSLICGRTNGNMAEYTGSGKSGLVVIRVERSISKGPISSTDMQQWVDAVAPELLVAFASKKPNTTTDPKLNSSLSSIARAWVSPPIPAGWKGIGPQAKVRTISSIFSVFSDSGIAGDACREVPSGLLILPSDQNSDSSIVVLSALGSTIGASQAPAQLAAAARVFPTHQAALDWVANMNVLVTTCSAVENMTDRFFSKNNSDEIRWSGGELRGQPSSGLIIVIGNAVFTAAADADAGVLSQSEQDSWVAAAEKSARSSVG